MTVFKRVCSIVLVVALVATVFAVAIYTGTSAETPETTNYGLTVSSKAVNEKGDAVVNVSVSGAVKGVQFTANFDNTVVEDNPAVAKLDPVASDDYEVYSNYEAGKVKVLLFSDKTIPEDKVLSITFKSKSLGTNQTTDVTLSDVTLTDVSGADVASDKVTLTGGEIAIFPENTSIIKVAAANLELLSDVTLAGKVALSFNDEYQDVYMTFRMDDWEKKIYPSVDSKGQYELDDKGRMIFEFKNVNPDEYAKSVVMKAHGTLKADGKEYSSIPQNYSVVQYCANQFKADVDVTWKRLFADLLNYGSAAQDYVEDQAKQAGSPIDTGIRSNSVATVKDYVVQYQNNTKPEDMGLTTISTNKYKVVDNPKAKWNAANLELGGAVIIRAYFSLTDSGDSISNYTVKAYSNAEEKTLLATYSGSDIQYDTEKERYFVKYGGFGPHMMSNAIYFVVCDSQGNEVSNTLRYSIESYAYSNSQPETDQYLKAMCVNMMKYGRAAENVPR